MALNDNRTLTFVDGAVMELETEEPFHIIILLRHKFESCGQPGQSTGVNPLASQPAHYPPLRVQVSLTFPT